MTTNRILLYALIGLLSWSCSKNDEPKGGDNSTPSGVDASTPYVLILGTENNSYVFANAPSFDTGTYDSAANSKDAIQMQGDRRIHFYKDRYLYTFVYNRDDPGKSASFERKASKLSKRKEYDLKNSIQARTDFGASVVGTYSDREYFPKEAVSPTSVKFFRFDTTSDAVSDPIEWDSKNFDNIGEVAYITDLRQYKDYLLAAIRPIKAYLDEGVFPQTKLLLESRHTHTTYIGVFDHNFRLVKVIKGDKGTGVIGGLIKATGKSGVEVLDSGEVYAFAAAFNATDRPSAVLKVNVENGSFDDTYFVNLTQKSGNRKLFRTHYLGGTRFCLQFFDKIGLDVTEFGDASGKASKFAIFDVATQQLDMLTGEPEYINSITDPYVDKAQQKIYFGINTDNTDPAIYVIDANAETISKGLIIKGQEVRALGVMKSE